MKKNMKAHVSGVGHFVPEEIYTNSDLAKLMDTSDEWIKERTGIEQRRLAGIGDSTSDFGLKAAKNALAMANLEAKDLDLILAATLSPDYFFPGIGVQIQDKLGANTIPAIDLRGQCSGFCWAMSAADAYVRSGMYKNVLVVGAEIHSKLLEFSNRGRNTSVLFGDAAGSIVVQGESAEEKGYPEVSNKISGFIDHELGSDGSGAESLAVMRPGFSAGQKEFITPEEVQEKHFLPFMDGRKVFKNAVARMTEAASKLLARHNLKIEDIDLLIPHQANLRINEMIRKKMGLPEEKVFNNIQKYGNTTAATLPLCMSEAVAEGRLKKGDLLLTIAFGSGFTWGANLLRW